MKIDDNQSAAADLRQRAEDADSKNKDQSFDQLASLSPEATKQTLHELRVHQIQLEMQNDELRRAQVELDAARARYFDLYDLAPVGYFTITEKGLILEANLTAASLLGEDRGGLVNHPVLRFILKEDQDIYHLHCKKIFEKRTQQTCKLRMVKKDGTIFWARLEGTLARNADDASICRVVLSDITEQKRSEKAKEKLENESWQLQKTESLGRMAGAIAHHFNNQLQVVMMNLRMALQNSPQNAELVEYLTEARQAARKATEVSALMLTYLGQTAARHEPLYLCEACQRHLPMLRAVMPQNVVLETDLPCPGPVINADANQIQQILTNLLTNAWEAIGKHPRVIRLALKQARAADIPETHRFPIDCKLQESDYACLEVADSACGIATEDMHKLFDPFFSTKFTGRGLGLAVVLGIVRAHSGIVTVESQPGRGSVFRVFLPLSAEAVHLKSEPVAQPPRTAVGGTVLVIDDEPCLRKSVEKVLKRFGFTVYAAEDGVEGVEVFQQHREEIGCVLCDLTMPRMNGWDTLAALRKLSPAIPVILSSGYSEAQVMEGDHSELPQAFLSKPYDLDALADALARAMRNPKALNGTSNIHQSRFHSRQNGVFI